MLVAHVGVSGKTVYLQLLKFVVDNTVTLWGQALSPTNYMDSVHMDFVAAITMSAYCHECVLNPAEPFFGLCCHRSFDRYGFSRAHSDTLHRDDDSLRIRLRRNELIANRMVDVSYIRT